MARNGAVSRDLEIEGRKCRCTRQRPSRWASRFHHGDYGRVWKIQFTRKSLDVIFNSSRSDVWGRYFRSRGNNCGSEWQYGCADRAGAMAILRLYSSSLGSFPDDLGKVTCY